MSKSTTENLISRAAFPLSSPLLSSPQLFHSADRRQLKRGSLGLELMGGLPEPGRPSFDCELINLISTQGPAADGTDKKAWRAHHPIASSSAPQLPMRLHWEY